MADSVGDKRRLGSSFSALLTATFITNLGDGLRFAALPLLATTLTSSKFLISAVAAAQFLPWMTFAPFGGVIVDRADRRRLILVTQLWRAGVMAALAIAVATGAARIWQLILVAFVLTVGEILVDPSVVATLPTLVRSDQLDRANSQITTVEVVTNDFVGGPVGAASFAVAPWLPFVLDALSYGASTAPFSRLPSTERKPAPEQPRPSPREEITEGLRWIRGHPFLRPVVGATAVFHLGTNGAFAMLVLLVTEVLAAPDIMFGVVLSAAAAGATLASLASSWLVERLSRQVVVTSAACIAGMSVLGAAVSTSIWQLMAIWVANGAAGGVLLAIGRGFVQRHTPNDRLGRTAIAQRMITRSSFVIGALLAGVVASIASVRWAYGVAGTFHLIGAAMYWRAFLTEPEPIATS